jgi:hypothetical protein
MSNTKSFYSEYSKDSNVETPKHSNAPDDKSESRRKTRSRRRAASISGLPRLTENVGNLDAAGPSSFTLGISSNAKRRKSGRKISSNSSDPSTSDNPYFPNTFSSISPPSPAPPSSLATLETVSSSMSVDQVLGSQIRDIFQQGPYSMYASPLPISVGDVPPTASPLRPSLLAAPLTDESPYAPWKDTRVEDMSATITINATYDAGPSPAEAPEILFSNVELPPTQPASLAGSQTVVATPTATYPGEANHDQGSQRDENALGLPFNPSEYGIVHLPSLPASRSTSERSSSATSSRYRDGKSGSGKSRLGSTHKFLRDSKVSSATGSGSSSFSNQAATSMSPQPGTGVGTPSSSEQSQRGSSEVFSSDDVGSSLTSDEPYTTFKFRTLEDENGNHVVIGREGNLERCEDEVCRLFS